MCNENIFSRAAKLRFKSNYKRYIRLINDRNSYQLYRWGKSAHLLFFVICKRIDHT